jgi:hypothetical protein
MTFRYTWPHPSGQSLLGSPGAVVTADDLIDLRVHGTGTGTRARSPPTVIDEHPRERLHLTHHGLGSASPRVPTPTALNTSCSSQICSPNPLQKLGRERYCKDSMVRTGSISHMATPRKRCEATVAPPATVMIAAADGRMLVVVLHHCRRWMVDADGRSVCDRHRIYRAFLELRDMVIEKREKKKMREARGGCCLQPQCRK